MCGPGNFPWLLAGTARKGEHKDGYRRQNHCTAFTEKSVPPAYSEGLPGLFHRDLYTTFSPCSVVARALSMIFNSSNALLNFNDSFFSAQTISPCQVEFSRYCTCTTNVPFFPSVFLFFSSCKHLTYPPIWFSVYRNFSISSIIPNILFLNLFRLCYFSYFFVPFERVLSYHWCTVSLYEM